MDLSYHPQRDLPTEADRFESGDGRVGTPHGGSNELIRGERMLSTVVLYQSEFDAGNVRHQITSTSHT